MDALEKAKEAAQQAEGDMNWDGVAALAAKAQAYAAIAQVEEARAQTEQLKRIADMMDLAMTTGENYDGTPARWVRVDDGRA